MECAQTRTATLLKLYVKTQGIQVSQSTFPPDFREWPEGKLFLETSLLSCLQTREAALQLSGHFTSPHSYCLKFSADSHKGHSYMPGWAPRYACTPSFWGNLDSFNCTAVVPFTDQRCWGLEECGLERLGNREGQKWDSRWRSELPLEVSPHCPLCLVTYLAHAWKSFLAENCIARSKIQGSLAFK